MQDLMQRVEVMDREILLIKHRLQHIEGEDLPRRIAVVEPTVERLEQKIDGIGNKLDLGLHEVRDAILAQRSLQKGVVFAVGAVVGIIQLLPFLKSLLVN